MIRTSRFLAAVAGAALMTAPASALAATHQARHPAARAAALGTVNWQINLKPGVAYPKATGGAQYQSQPGQAELQVEVERIRSLAGQAVTISVDGSPVGTAKVTPRGIAQLTRNSELHQLVPTIVHGSTVSVSTAGGTLVASGTF